MMFCLREQFIKNFTARHRPVHSLTEKRVTSSRIIIFRNAQIAKTINLCTSNELLYLRGSNYNCFLFNNIEKGKELSQISALG